MDSKIGEYFGKALVRVRTRLGISQYQLAKISGISEEYLNKLENGKREPRAAMIIRLGRAMGIAPGELINVTDRLMRKADSESS